MRNLLIIGFLLLSICSLAQKKESSGNIQDDGSEKVKEVPKAKETSKPERISGAASKNLPSKRLGGAKSSGARHAGIGARHAGGARHASGAAKHAGRGK